MKYLITYEGVVTNSYAGRDDGYPETKTVVASNKNDLVAYLGKKDVKFYTCNPMPTHNVEHIKQVLEEANKKRAEQEKEDREEALNKLNAKDKKALGL